MTARDLRAALAAAAADVATKPHITLKEIIARARLRDPSLRAYPDTKLHELLGSALAHSTLPDGPPGEAALAYLVAFRAAQDPVACAIAALRRQDADIDGNRRVLSEWLGEQGQRLLAQAEAVRLEIARRARLQ